MLALSFDHFDDVIHITVPPSNQPRRIDLTLVATNPRVKIGFTAAKEVEILRHKVLLRKQADNLDGFSGAPLAPGD